MHRDMEFAVVDVETTGLFPQCHDRIIEIAVVRMDGNGTVLDEYCTLVNPNRDLGPSQLHGISAADLRNAPTFDEVVGDIVSRMSGAVFVAHNVTFDARFVTAELGRVGITTPELCTLCTMALSMRLDPPAPGRRLEWICGHLGIPLPEAHTAHGDASAAASILAHCLAQLRAIEELNNARDLVDAQLWPKLTPSGRCYLRTDSARDRKRERSYIGALLDKIPPSSERSACVDAYLDLLDRVLEDRRVTEEEYGLLIEHAESTGLTREQALQANRRYMDALIDAAWADRRLSDAERADLEQVRKLLCIPESEYEAMLRDGQSRAGSSDAGTRPSAADDLAGKSVCFTGQLTCTIGGEPITRSFAQEVATARGMDIKSGVTKSLDYLVLADPDSMSGKAKKARDYGTRLLAETVFWQMMGVDVD